MPTRLPSDSQDQPEPPRAQRWDEDPDSPPRRWTKRGLLAISLVAVLVLAAAMIRGANSSQETGTRKTHTITRSDLIVTVTEKGTLTSSKNTEIKCDIRGGYGGRGGDSTVIWIIPAGTIVQTGDELVRLDSKIIEETVSLGKTDVHIATAELERTKADLAKAELAVDAYREGSYISQMKSLQKRLITAKWNHKTAEEMLNQTELLSLRGFVNELEVEGNAFTVKQTDLELTVIETQIDVLERFTKAMELETLNGQLSATKARLAGRKAGLELEQNRLKLAMQEFENCVIRAEKGGLVIYPSAAKWKNTPDITEGASVHKDQVLLLMPDLTQLQVQVGIHESVIDRIKPGQRVQVTLVDRTLDTEVSSVASVATPAGWWNGNEVRYDTVIQIPKGHGLKTGMTADVEVIVARHESVLPVPVAGVVESDQGHFCWVETKEGTRRRTLQLGDSNDEFIVVEAGLSEGDKVVLNPLDSIADARKLVGLAVVHTIARGDLLVTLTEQGTLESSDNTKIKCRVRGKGTINWVIESGTKVKPGDELVRLENKQIEDYLHERTKFAYLSRDAAIGFRADATRAGLAMSEYEEGRFRSELMTLQKDKAIAESKLRNATNMLDHAKKLFERGFRSEVGVEEKTFAVMEARLEAEIKQAEIEVLEQFTKEEELETLRGNWESAKAAAAGHEEVLAMDQERMGLATKEIERCVIRAERSGLVIYPTTEEWKNAPDIAEGATVHNDQVLLLMPDLSKMQVKIGIHESMINSVNEGMTATVTLPGRTLVGEVTAVASVAPPAEWWTGNIVKYDAIIQLPSVDGLKPGMSAAVEVNIARQENVLLIPVAAVVETEHGYFCWVGSADKAQRRTLQVGASNDDYFVVNAGLQEGDRVVLNPSLFFEEAEIRQSPAPRSPKS